MMRWRTVPKEERTMQLTRITTETTTGPSDWFTGTVYMDPVAAPAGSYGISATNVHFTPGARTAWHAHPNGQTIFVTDGDRKSTRLNSSHTVISYAVFCLKKKKP